MEQQLYILQLKFKQLKKELAEKKHRNSTLTTPTKLRTYKSTKFSKKNNKDISTFMECYRAKAELIVESFKE
jgi:hypothetical protein